MNSFFKRIKDYSLNPKFAYSWAQKMVSDPYFERRELSETGLIQHEFESYGFYSVSFLHVFLAKIFFLVLFGLFLVPITIVIAIITF